MPPVAESRPLTKRQQKLVMSEESQQIVEQAARKFAAKPWARLSGIGYETVRAECQVALCVAARKFDPVKYKGVPFGAYLWMGLKRWFRGVRMREFKARNSFRQTPEVRNEKGEVYEFDRADYRRPDGETVCPLLKAWCSPDYATARRTIHIRYRLVLYLRYVECMTLDEAGAALGITRERVRQVEARGMELMCVKRPDAARHSRTVPRKG